MNSNVFTAFRDLWRIVDPEERRVPSQEDMRLEHERRMAMVHDMRVFIKTQAFKDYREWIEHEIEQNAPNPAYGSDVAACYTFKREGLMVALRRLDTMVKLAEERLEDANAG